jgi:hypothetical protein
MRIREQESHLVLLLILLASLSFEVPLSVAQGGAKWTFMVYLDADNNLDLAGVSDMVEMQSVGSSSDVGVGVLFGRCGERCGFNGSELLLIHNGWNKTLTKDAHANLTHCTAENLDSTAFLMPIFIQ